MRWLPREQELKTASVEGLRGLQVSGAQGPRVPRPSRQSQCKAMDYVLYLANYNAAQVFNRATRALEMTWRRIVAAPASMQCEFLSRARQYYVVCYFNGAISCVEKNYAAASARRWLAHDIVGWYRPCACAPCSRGSGQGMRAAV
jgi:hypothetical protein